MWIVSNRKIIRIPESGKILLIEAGIRGCFACGIQHPANNWNSESKFHWQGIRNSVSAESGIRSAESRMQDCLGLMDHCTQIWIVLLTGRAAREICFNPSGALPISERYFWLAVPHGKFSSTNRSTTLIWPVTRHQLGISALIPQTSFRSETAGGVAYCFSG